MHATSQKQLLQNGEENSLSMHTRLLNIMFPQLFFQNYKIHFFFPVLILCFFLSALRGFSQTQTTPDTKIHGAQPLKVAAVPRTIPAKRTVMAAMQAALDRHGFGVGIIDGLAGVKTKQAFDDYRNSHKPPLDEKDGRTSLLETDEPSFVWYTISADDLNKVGTAPVDWEEAAAVATMACESLLEVISEKFHISERLLPLLNPEISDWDNIEAGTNIRVTNIRPADEMLSSIGSIVIDIDAFRLRVFDATNNLAASFPCSIARERAKVPDRDLSIVAIAPRPNYTFNPANFPDSPRAQAIGRKLIINPGPNNPVGVFWISLSLPGYGIHGTPKPATIGNMESRGCFRLCNWDAHTLGYSVKPGIPVLIKTSGKTKTSTP